MKINKQGDLVKIAHITGMWYLILAIAGVLGFLVLNPRLFVTDDPVKTLLNLTEHESLARIRLLLEFVIIIAQALTAVYFYKLFRNINKWGAWVLGIWGTVNAVIILINAISMGSALGIAGNITLSIEDKVMLIQLLQQFGANAWGVGGIFFGLWLIPMGYIIINSGRMPVWLGRLINLGGFGYLLSTFLNYSGLNSTMVDMLAIPATIGEFWMIGYLFVYGIRPARSNDPTL